MVLYRNPEMMRQMQRSNDRALSNIEVRNIIITFIQGKGVEKGERKLTQ